MAPLLLIILFGIIEFGWLFMARSIVLEATSVAVRTATFPGYEGTGDQAEENNAALEAIVEEILAAHFQIPAGLVVMTRDPATDAATDPNEVITVSVPIGRIKLPGILLDVFFDTSDNGDKIEMTLPAANPLVG